MRLKKILVGTSVAVFLTIGFACESQHFNTFAQSAHTAGTVSVAVGPQYDTTHVYVAPQDFDGFVASLIATFGGTTTKQGVFTVTPTPSSTMSQLVLTPVGTISVFGFKTPVPYPFGLERTGYLVTDMDEAIRAAKATGADVLVAAFNDPIGRDAIIQWPGHRWRSSRRGGACRGLALSSMGGACLQHSEIADLDRAWPVFVLLLPPRLWLTVAHFRAVLLTALPP